MGNNINKDVGDLQSYFTSGHNIGQVKSPRIFDAAVTVPNIEAILAHSILLSVNANSVIRP